MGGAVAAVESGYMKSELVASHAARRAPDRVRRGHRRRRQQVHDHRAQPAHRRPRRRDPDRRPGRRAGGARQRWRVARATRRRRRRRRARPACADAAQDGVNLMAATLACARAGVTTGEWAGALREVFGEYRAPTGVGGAPVTVAEQARNWPPSAPRSPRTGDELGGRLRLLVGKPGLDGHSNGAEQIAVRARDAGFEVDLPGHPADPGADRGRRGRGGRALRRAVDPVRLAHGLVPEVLRGLREAGTATSRSSSAGSSRRPTRALRARGSPPSSRPRTSGSPRSLAVSSTRSGSLTISSR